MATFLLEVGTEELPADFVDSALAQWRSRLPQALSEHYLQTEALELYGTPRRLAVLIKGLPDRQPDREELVKGPSAQAAFKDGQPTKAAEGFVRSRGASVSDLEIRSTEKGDFVFLQQQIPGRPTAEILQELALGWISALEGRRFMRWGTGDLRFPRPIRWLVALLDDAVLPLTLPNDGATVTSDRVSQGHRVLHPDPVTLDHADHYLDRLRKAFVEPDVDIRRQAIEAEIKLVAEKAGGVAEISPDLLEEVTQLVEWPTAVLGTFEDEFLELPPEVITTVMVTHQRYFPVFQSDPSAPGAALLPRFITISNGDPKKSDIIAAGNARVIRARLADGQFFYKADCGQSLEKFLPQLETVTFQEALGSMGDKVKRIEQIAGQIAEQLGVSAGDRALIERAALLCKADLVTQMVFEFPELQGIMGEKYARVSGEPAAVAQAISEHYLPKGAGDRLPPSLVGQVVGLADRLDTLVSIFALGLIPSGSSDPFALRRAATAIVNIIWGADLAINLSALLDQVVQRFSAEKGAVMKLSAADLLGQLRSFFLQRIQTLLQEDRHIDYDLVSAVLGEDDPEYTERALQDLLDVRDRAQFLQTIRQDGTLEPIYEIVNRASRLAVKGDLDTVTLDPANVVDAGLFQQPSEQAFYEALGKLLPETQAAQSARDYRRLVTALADTAPTISNFFDGPQSVLVMDENPDIRRNRLNLLGLLRNHARVLADFGPIVKR